LTRDTALKGLTLIALNDTTDNRSRQQPLQRHEVVNLQGMNQHLPALLDLLNKSQRQLQLNTLECLEALTRRYSAQFKANVA